MSHPTNVVFPTDPEYEQSFIRVCEYMQQHPAQFGFNDDDLFVGSEAYRAVYPYGVHSGSSSTLSYSAVIAAGEQHFSAVRLTWYRRLRHFLSHLCLS